MSESERMADVMRLFERVCALRAKDELVALLGDPVLQRAITDLVDPSPEDVESVLQHLLPDNELRQRSMGLVQDWHESLLLGRLRLFGSSSGSN